MLIELGRVTRETRTCTFTTYPGFVDAPPPAITERLFKKSLAGGAVAFCNVDVDGAAGVWTQAVPGVNCPENIAPALRSYNCGA